VADPESFRQHLTEVFGQHPELFPASIDEGVVLPDTSWSITQQRMLEFAQEAGERAPTSSPKMAGGQDEACGCTTLLHPRIFQRKRHAQLLGLLSGNTDSL